MQRRSFLQTSTVASLASLASAEGSKAGPTSEKAEGDPVDLLTSNLNPQIQHARDVALAILKPTASELERGLRLHAESIVFDSYGFSPRAAIDGDVLAATMEAGASPQEIEDLQEDMTMTRYVTDPVEQQEYQKCMAGFRSHLHFSERRPGMSGSAATDQTPGSIQFCYGSDARLRGQGRRPC
jgi:membrane dipeptidase